MQIALGATGLDIVTDIRDISADVINWEWSKEHVLQTGLDLVGLVPVVGAIKNVDELATVAKHSDLIDKAVSASFKNSDEVATTTNKLNDVVKRKRKKIPVVDPDSNSSYRALRKANKGKGKEVHHLIEQRFAISIGIPETETDEMLSKALDIDVHRGFTNDWQYALPYGSEYMPEQIIAVAKKVYSEHHDYLAAEMETMENGLKNIK